MPTAVRQNGVKPPPGYKTSISICGAFLKQHAPKKADGEVPGKLEPKPVSPAQMLYAKKIAYGKGLIIPAAMLRFVTAFIEAQMSTQQEGRHPS